MPHPDNQSLVPFAQSLHAQLHALAPLNMPTLAQVQLALARTLGVSDWATLVAVFDSPSVPEVTPEVTPEVAPHAAPHAALHAVAPEMPSLVALDFSRLVLVGLGETRYHVRELNPEGVRVLRDFLCEPALALATPASEDERLERERLLNLTVLELCAYPSARQVFRMVRVRQLLALSWDAARGAFTGPGEFETTRFELSHPFGPVAVPATAQDDA